MVNNNLSRMKKLTMHREIMIYKFKKSLISNFKPAAMKPKLKVSRNNSVFLLSSNRGLKSTKNERGLNPKDSNLGWKNEANPIIKRLAEFRWTSRSQSNWNHWSSSKIAILKSW